MQAERLGVEIEIFLCAVCRHRQVVVAVDTRHGRLLPEVWLSPRRFGQSTKVEVAAPVAHRRLADVDAGLQQFAPEIPAETMIVHLHRMALAALEIEMR